LVYVVGHKNKRTDTADALLAAGGTICVQVLNELANVSRKKLRSATEKSNEGLSVPRNAFG